MASGSEFPLPEASVPASVFFWSGSAPASSVSARSTPPSVSVSLPPSVLSTRSAISWSDSFSPPSCYGSSTKAISVVTRSRISVLAVKTAPAASTAIPQIHRPSLFLRPFLLRLLISAYLRFCLQSAFLSSLCVCCRSVISLLFCPHAFSAVSVLRTGRSRSSSYHCRSSDSYPPCGRNTARCLRKP